MPTYSRQTLPNGLRVITIAVPHQKSVYFKLSMRGGNRHRLADEIGLAHFTEHLTYHLAYRHLLRHPDSEHAAAELDGSTYADRVDFEVTTHKPSLPLVAEAMRVGLDLKATPAMIAHERTRMLDEARRKDTGGGEYRHNIADNRTCFCGTTLIIPSPDEERAGIKRLTLAQARHFARAAWRPETSILTVAGDVTPALVGRLAKGIFPPSALPPLPLPVTPRFAPPGRVKIPTGGNGTARATFSWLSPLPSARTLVLQGAMVELMRDYLRDGLEKKYGLYYTDIHHITAPDFNALDLSVNAPAKKTRALARDIARAPADFLASITERGWREKTRRLIQDAEIQEDFTRSLADEVTWFEMIFRKLMTPAEMRRVLKRANADDAKTAFSLFLPHEPFRTITFGN